MTVASLMNSSLAISRLDGPLAVSLSTHFARGQRRQLGRPFVPSPGVSGLLGERFDQAAGDAGREERVSPADRRHRGEQLLRPRVLEWKAAGTGTQGAVDILVQVEGGQDEDPGQRVRRVGEDLLGGRDAAHAGPCTFVGLDSDHYGMLRDPGADEVARVVARLSPRHGT